jgi:hypothetical protein
MTVQPPSDGTGTGTGRGGPGPGTPGWVKIFGTIAAAVVVLVIVLHLTGNSFGGH